MRRRPIDEVLRRYDAYVLRNQAVMIAKNDDYGGSWEGMRPESITDQLDVKVQRIKTLERKRRQGQKPRISEGIEAELLDIMNYCVFRLIKEEEWAEEHRWMIKRALKRFFARLANRFRASFGR